MRFFQRKKQPEGQAGKNQIISFALNRKPGRRYFWLKGILVFTLLIFIAGLFFLKPQNLGLPACQFKSLTGYSCPSCGLTRSLFAISHLRFWDSLQLHPMGIVFYFFIFVLLLKFSLEFITATRIEVKINPRLLKYGMLFLAGVWLVFWLLRLLNEMYVG